MDVLVELSEKDIKQIVKSYLEDKLNRDIDNIELQFEVKSKQNYKSEWERAAFKVTYRSSKM